MTRRESAIISAFTGFTCGPFSAMHEYAEELFGRPVYTHEFGDKVVADKLKELARKDFVALCESVPNES